jgi:Flp pilus assembly protein TadD
MRIASFFLIFSLAFPFSVRAAETPKKTAGAQILTLETMHGDAEKLVIEGRFREAVRVYSDIILVEPDDETAYANMGHAYMILGDYGRARQAFMNALHINPDNQVAYLGMQKIIDPDSSAN